MNPPARGVFLVLANQPVSRHDQDGVSVGTVDLGRQPERIKVINRDIAAGFSARDKKRGGSRQVTADEGGGFGGKEQGNEDGQERQKPYRTYQESEPSYHFCKDSKRSATAEWSSPPLCVMSRMYTRGSEISVDIDQINDSHAEVALRELSIIRNNTTQTAGHSCPFVGRRQLTTQRPLHLFEGSDNVGQVGRACQVPAFLFSLSSVMTLSNFARIRFTENW